MAETPRRYFENPEPVAVLADFAAVAARMQRDVADGRRSLADATDTLALCWELVTRLLGPPSPTDPASLLPSC